MKDNEETKLKNVRRIALLLLQEKGLLLKLWNMKDPINIYGEKEWVRTRVRGVRSYHSIN